MTTMPPEHWGRRETATWWHAGHASRQHIYGIATEMMLDVATIPRGSRVLDVAAGTGEAALLAAGRVGPTGYVLAVDSAASMLTVAAEAVRTARMTHVETCVMNAERLALDADAFDAVLCRLALMLFPQPAHALTEMRRVVQPGGKVATMVYAAIDKNPYHGIFYSVVRRVGTLPPPAPGEPWMYALGDPGVLEDVYRRAGLRHVSVQAAALPRRFPSAADALRSMRHAAGDLRALMRRLTDADQERAWADMAQQLRQFEGPQGFEAPGEVLIGVGTK